MTYCKHRRRKAWLTASQREVKGEERESAGIKDQEERKLLGRGHFVWFRSCVRSSMYGTTRSHQIQGHNKEVDVSTRAHAGTRRLA
jgi:hypothetical protein